MTKKTKKVPNLQKIKNTKEVPQTKEIRNYKVGWNFKYIETDHKKYRIKYAYFLIFAKDIVDRFEGKTIAEIEKTTNHTHKWYDSSVLDKEFQNILKNKHLEQEQIMQLALDSKTRIWGFVRGNIFHFLCMDFDHSIYKVLKKHT